jgi:hypothetical protein
MVLSVKATKIINAKRTLLIAAVPVMQRLMSSPLAFQRSYSDKRKRYSNAKFISPTNAEKLLQRRALAAGELWPAAPQVCKHRIKHHRAHYALHKVAAIEAIKTVDTKYTSLASDDLM